MLVDLSTPYCVFDPGEFKHSLVVVVWRAGDRPHGVIPNGGDAEKPLEPFQSCGPRQDMYELKPSPDRHYYDSWAIHTTFLDVIKGRETATPRTFSITLMNRDDQGWRFMLQSQTPDNTFDPRYHWNFMLPGFDPLVELVESECRTIWERILSED